jgi:tetratricopeptide (TPR) repeat protein
MFLSFLRHLSAAVLLSFSVASFLAPLAAQEPGARTFNTGGEELLSPSEKDLEVQRQKLESIRAKEGDTSATYLEHCFDEVGLLAGLGRLPEAEKLLSELEGKASAMQGAAGGSRANLALLRSAMLNARLHVLQKQGRHEDFIRTSEERLACISELTDPEMRLVELDVMAGAVFSLKVFLDQPLESSKWMARLIRRLDEPGCRVAGRNARPLLSASFVAQQIGSKPEVVRLAEAARQAALTGGVGHEDVLLQSLIQVVENMPDARGLLYVEELKKLLEQQLRQADGNPALLKLVVRGFSAVAVGCVMVYHEKKDPLLLKEARQAYEVSHTNAMRWLSEENSKERASYTCKYKLDLAVVDFIERKGRKQTAVLEKELAAAEQTMGQDDSRLNDYRDMLLEIYQKDSRHEEALELLAGMLERSTRMNGEKHPLTATVHHLMGRSLASLGRSEEAVKKFEKAAALREASLGTRHPDVGRSYYNLGAMREAAQDFVGAQAYYEHVLGIDREAYGPDSTQACHDVISIVLVLGRQNQISKAQEHMERQISLLNNQSDRHLLSRAELRLIMAPVLSERGQFTKAKTLLEINLQELHGKKPDFWPMLAASHMALAEYNHRLDHIEAAAEHLKMQLSLLWSIQHQKGGCEGGIAKASEDYSNVLKSLRHAPGEIHKLLKAVESGVDY